MNTATNPEPQQPKPSAPAPCSDAYPGIAYKSVTALAAENPNLAEYIAQIESESQSIKEQRRELVELLTKEREGIARFLVPYRHRLPESWLDHFSEECGVYFDACFYVHPRPILLKCLNAQPNAAMSDAATKGKQP